VLTVPSVVIKLSKRGFQNLSTEQFDVTIIGADQAAMLQPSAQRSWDLKSQSLKKING